MISFFTIYLSSLAALLIWWYMRRTVRLANKIPGPTHPPIVGAAIHALFIPKERFMERAYKWYLEYGTIYRTWQGPIPAIHICGAEYAEKLLSDPKYIRKGWAYSLLEPWLGTGLLTSRGDKWFKHRKMITPTFHFKILDGFVDIFNTNSELLVKKLREKSEENQEFDIYQFITKCALDIVCETAMGVQIHAQQQDKNSYVTAVYDVSRTTIARHFTFWLIPNFSFYNLPIGKKYVENLNTLHGFTEKVIKDRMESRKTKGETNKFEANDLGRKKKVAFLDLLLDANANEENKLSFKEIREEVDTFMFEGHDTTTAAMYWTVLLLAQHPEIQEEVYQELKTILPDDRSPTMADLNEMKCLERVIKETLRLFPSVPFITRWLEEDIQLGPYTVPKWSTAVVQIINLHKDPKYFPEPLKFDPDRFLPENIQKRHPYAYIPFSAGQRNCIGQKFAMLEEKCILSYLIRNFIFETSVKREDIKLLIELVLRPQSNLMIKLTPRSLEN